MAKNVELDIVAKDKTRRAFASVTGGLAKVSKESAKTVGKIAKIGSAFALVAGGATAALTKASMQNIDALAKTADKIGITTQALGGLQHAAELTGVSGETMNMALQRMTRRVSEAANGTGEAVKALDELGLNAAELEKLPLDVQMGVVADAMGNVTNQSDRVRLAMKLFDSEGVALVNTLAGGSAGLSAMAKESELLGLSISRVDAAQIEAANDSITKAQGVFEGIGNQIAVTLSPLVSELAANFYQSALDMNDSGNVGERVANALVKGFAKFADIVHNLRIGFNFVRFAIAKMAQGALLAVSKIASKFNGLIDAYNLVAEAFGRPLITTKPSEELALLAQSFGTVATNLKADIDEAMAGPLPSEGIMTFYNEVQAKARETAEVVAANAPGQIVATDFKTSSDTVLQTSTITQNAILAQSSTLLSTTQSNIGALEGVFAEGSAGAKAFFVVSQALAAGTAIVNGLMSAMSIRAAYAQLAALTANPGLLAIGEAHANVTAAMGFATAGIIAGQTLASFDGGGFTGHGARAGGVDGRGGFPAILHPNESVIDHNRSGQGVTIINNVDATGGADVDLKIASAMELASARTVETIHNLMSRRRFA